MPDATLRVVAVVAVGLGWKAGIASVVRQLIIHRPPAPHAAIYTGCWLFFLHRQLLARKLAPQAHALTHVKIHTHTHTHTYTRAREMG